MKTNKIIILITALFLLTGPAAAQAGWVFEEMRDNEKQITYVQDNVFRFDTGENQGLIFDLANERLYLFHDQAKVHWEGSPKEFEREMKAIVMKTIEQMIEQMGLEGDKAAEMKKKMQDNMAKSWEPGGLDLKIEVKPTSDEDTMAGYKTKKYEVYSDGQLKQELWLAENVQLGQELDIDKLSRLMLTLAPKDERIVLTFSPEVSKLYETGWPMKTVEHLGEGNQSVSETIKAEEKTLEKSLFKVSDESRAVGMEEYITTAGGGKKQ